MLMPHVAGAEPWVEDKNFFTDVENNGSSMVDAADLDGDGWIDLVFANGGGYDKGDVNSDLPQQAFKNEAGAATSDISNQVFGDSNRFNGRAIKARDIDRDGDIDVVLGVTWQRQSQLFINSDGQGTFVNETETHLPQLDASIGDLELGDVDGDGDLDMVLADWGPDAPVGDPVATEGGITQLWTQIGEPADWAAPGTGMFDDATLGNMPLDKVRWSWDLELVDIDNDYDLDVAVSCFSCSKSSVLLFANDGGGKFINVTPGNVTQGLGAFDVEALDLDNDNFLDLITLRDGTSGRNRVLINNTQGGFEDKTDLIWPKLENPASFDHMIAYLDYNSDQRPDAVVGAFHPGKVYPDRLLENQNGKFKQNTFAFTAATPATYALVLADFNQDRILDVAMSQNENAFDKKVFLGSNVDLQPDTAAPIFNNYQKLAEDIEFGVEHTLHVRCHDNKSPLMQHDFQREADGKPDGRPFVESWNSQPADPDITPPDQVSPHGEWYGEYLWRVTFEVPKAANPFVYRICAIDAAGNKACTPIHSVDNPDDSTTGGLTASESDSTTVDPTTQGTGVSIGDTSDSESESESETAVVPTTMYIPGPTTGESASETVADSASQLDDDGCGCDASGSPTGGVLSSLALLGLLGLRRRRGA